MIESRVIPCRIPVERSGVKILPPETTKIVSPGPSATFPSGVSRIASSYPARRASFTASIELR